MYRMTTELSITDIIATIEVSIWNNVDDESIVRNDATGEVIAVYSPGDEAAAQSHFRSLLTAEQLEALEIDAQVTNMLQGEEYSNRELSGQY